MDYITESESFNEENAEVDLIEDTIKEFIEEENIDDHLTEGFLVSDESDRKLPKQ